MNTGEDLKAAGKEMFDAFTGNLKKYHFAKQCLDDYFEQAGNVRHKTVEADPLYLETNIYFELICFSAYCMAINAASHFQEKHLFKTTFDKAAWVEVYEGIEEALYSEASTLDESMVDQAEDGARHALIGYMQNLMDHDARADIPGKISQAEGSNQKMGFALFSERMSTGIDVEFGCRWRAFLTQWIPTGEQLYQLTKQTTDEVMQKYG